MFAAQIPADVIAALVDLNTAFEVTHDGTELRIGVILDRYTYWNNEGRHFAAEIAARDLPGFAYEGTHFDPEIDPELDRNDHHAWFAYSAPVTPEHVNAVSAGFATRLGDVLNVSPTYS